MIIEVVIAFIYVVLLHTEYKVVFVKWVLIVHNPQNLFYKPNVHFT